MLLLFFAIIENIPVIDKKSKIDPFVTIYTLTHTQMLALRDLSRKLDINKINESYAYLPVFVGYY